MRWNDEELHAIRRVNDDGTKTFLGVTPAWLAGRVIPQLLHGGGTYTQSALTQAERDLLTPREPGPEPAKPEPAVTVHLPGTVTVRVNAGGGESLLSVPLGDVTLPGGVEITLEDGREVTVTDNGRVSVRIPTPGNYDKHAEVVLILPGADDLQRCDDAVRAREWDARNPGLDSWNATAADPYPDAGDTGTITIEATDYHG